MVQIGTGALLGLGGATVEASDGTKLAIFVDGSSVEIWSDIDGTPNLEDSDTATTAFGGGAFGWVAAAIDGSNTIHLVASCTTEQTRDVAYVLVTESAGVWTIQTWEQVLNYTNAAPTNAICSISLDNNGKPHVLATDEVKQAGSARDNVYYIEKTGASWSTPLKIGARTTKTWYYRDSTITLRNSNYIEAYYYMNDGTSKSAYKSYTGTWSSETTYSALSETVNFPGVTSTTGGTVYRYARDWSNSDVMENDVDTTFNGKTSNNFRGSGFLDGTDRYALYIDATDDIQLIENTGSGWSSTAELQTGTFEEVIVGWSYNYYNTTNEIIYLYDDGTYVHYGSYTLAAPPVTINLAVGALVLSGPAITVSVQAATITLGVGNLALNGIPMSVAVQAATIPLGIGDLVLTGNSITVAAQPSVVPLNVGDLVLSGPSITVFAPATIPLNPGLLALNGIPITVVAANSVVPLSVGDLILTGNAITIVAQNSVVPLGVGGLTLTGNSITVAVTVSVALSVGNLTLTGNAGDLTLTGNAITVSVASPQIIPLSVGNLALNGIPMTIAVQPATISLGVGDITLTGNALSVIAQSASIPLSVGALALNGISITVVAQNSVVALGVGDLTLTGPSMTVTYGVVTIPLSVGNLVLSGSVSVVAQNSVVPLSVGNLSVSGAAITVIAPATISLTPGLLALNGNSMTVLATATIPLVVGDLIVSAPSIAVISQPSVVPLNSGILTLTGNAITVLAFSPYETIEGVVFMNVAPSEIVLVQSNATGIVKINASPEERVYKQS
jgi:hypothetical protein